MTNCKYRTPCGICTIRTDADPTPNVHYCKADAKCEESPKIDSHAEYWDNIGRADVRGDV